MSSLSHSWLIVFVSSDSYLRRVTQVWTHRRRDFELEYERGYDALAQVQRSSCIVQVGKEFEVTEMPGTKVVLSLSTPLTDWLALRQIGDFVHQFCSQPRGDRLDLMIDPKELEAYRIASMITTYGQDKNRDVMLVDADSHQLEPLYGPPINITTRACLFSILDYIIRYRVPPDFSHLKAHHFSNLSFLEVQNPERTRRFWTGKNDSKYVTALYATVRTLESQRLVKKKMDATGRRIVSLEPTWNGVYTVVFSDLLQILSQTLDSEQEDEFEPEPDEDLSG